MEQIGTTPTETRVNSAHTASLPSSEETLGRAISLFADVQWGIGVITGDGTALVAASPALAQMHGYTVAEIVGVPLTKLLTPSAEVELPERLRIATEKGGHKFASSHVRKDGTVLPVLVDVRPARDGAAGLSYYALHVVDASQQREAEVAVGMAREIQCRHTEETLRRYTQRLEILHQIDHAILSAQSVEGLAPAALGHIRHLLPCQRASLVLFDFAAQQAIITVLDVNSKTRLEAGRRMPLSDFGDIETARQGQVQMVRDIAELPEPLPVDRSLLLDGIRSYAKIPLLADQDLLGSVNVGASTPGAFSSEAIEVAREVADQLAIAIRQAQLREEAAHNTAELEQRVAERTAELNEANRHLQEATERLRAVDHLKSQFVSNVSHELRTPLANLKLYLSLLRDGRPEKRERYLETFQREANRLESLVDGILDVSRLDLDKVQPVFAKLDLNQLVTTLVADRYALVADRGLTLCTEIDPVLPVVEADAKMLYQVLTNLMTNAMNYTSRGGSITVITRTIVADDKTWVSLSVEDTGVGISPDDMPHLFERFFRGVAARQTSAPGTGLGLAICKEIIDRHNGRIVVDSEVGKGSTFTIQLPASTTPPASETANIP